LYELFGNVICQIKAKQVYSVIQSEEPEKVKSEIEN